MSNGETTAAGWENPLPGALWLRTWRLGEWLHGPISPLFETFLLPLMVASRESAGTARLGWRMPRMFRMRHPAHLVLHGHYFARADPDRLSVLLLPPRFLWTELRGGWVGRFRDRSLPQYQQRLAQASRLLEAPPAALLAGLEELARDVAELWYALGLATGGAIPMQRFLARASQGAVTDENVLVLLAGFESPAASEQQSLWELAKGLERIADGPARLDLIPLDEILSGASGDPDLDAWGREVAAHLVRFGYQVRSLDFVHPCLDEEPDRLGAALRCYLGLRAQEPHQLLARAAARRDELKAAALAGLGGGKRRLYQALLDRAQDYARVREEIVARLLQAWPCFRRGFLALGRALATSGRLAADDDIFFVTRDELSATLTTEGSPSGKPAAAVLGERAAERRRRWLEQGDLEPPISIPPGDDPAWRRAASWPIRLRFDGIGGEAGRRVLAGTAASAGRVRGRARVLGFASEASRLAPGEVLVATATTPDWTPLFAIAGGVVTDVGGTASHSSIVAREYGIPAVVGTREATRVVRDGEMVTVDGNAGRVYFGDAEEGAEQ